ncbi:hypothetical protein D9M71_193170 [compost metagenome]
MFVQFAGVRRRIGLPLVHFLKAGQERAQALVEALQVAFEFALAAGAQGQHQYRQVVQHRHQFVPVQAALDARTQRLRLGLVRGWQAHLVEQAQQARLDMRRHGAVGRLRHGWQCVAAFAPARQLDDLRRGLEQTGRQRQGIQQRRRLFRVLAGLLRLLRAAAAEHSLQQATALAILATELFQDPALQGAEFAEQGRPFAQLAGARLDIPGEALERRARFPRHVQRQQLIGKPGECFDVLLDALLATPLRVQQGALQLRNQTGEADVHLLATEDFAQLLHALVDRPVHAFGGQAAAHQATAQQVGTRFPAAFGALLPVEVLQVSFLPVQAFVIAHSRAPNFPG